MNIGYGTGNEIHFYFLSLPNYKRAKVRRKQNRAHVLKTIRNILTEANVFGWTFLYCYCQSIALFLFSTGESNLKNRLCRFFFFIFSSGMVVNVSVEPHASVNDADYMHIRYLYRIEILLKCQRARYLGLEVKSTKFILWPEHSAYFEIQFRSQIWKWGIKKCLCAFECKSILKIKGKKVKIQKLQ